jgi:hypothetical protein
MARFVALLCLSVAFAAALQAQTLASIAPEQVDGVFAKWNKRDSPGCALAVLQNSVVVYERGYGMADLGPFLLLAARKPSLHRSLITFAACQSLAHASVMAIQTVEAWKHGVHRGFTDVVLFGVIGGILLALSLERRKLPKHLYSTQDSGFSSLFDGWSANLTLPD